MSDRSLEQAHRLIEESYAVRLSKNTEIEIFLEEWNAPLIRDCILEPYKIHHITPQKEESDFCCKVRLIPNWGEWNEEE